MSTFYKCAKAIVSIRFLLGHPTENLLGILTSTGTIANYLLVFESFLIPSKLSDRSLFQTTVLETGPPGLTPAEQNRQTAQAGTAFAILC